ncbi:MAG: hypothetical protein RL553_230 [Planctomycetota bacterium]|jgi:hypothetical protein
MQEVNLVLDHYDFFCPITGEKILWQEDCKSSPATAFIYVDDSQEFPFITPEFLKLFEEKCDFEDEDEDEDDGLEPYERFLLEIKDMPNLVVFNMNDSESSIMIRVGINMNYCKEE